jgi:hypothetical protein
MPFNVFCAGFLQPGDDLTGYNVTITEEPSYDGAGLWSPSLEGFDTLVSVLFYGGISPGRVCH